MTIDQPLSEEAKQDLLRRCWLWHDARWYAGVAAEFGLDAADRINRANVVALGTVEMRRLMKVLGVDRVGNLGEALELYAIARSIYVPSSLMEADVTDVAETSYDVVFRRCYVHENIVRAGIAGTYKCAVFDRIQGWHDAWGLPLAEDVPVRTCAMAAGLECRQRFALRQEG